MWFEDEKQPTETSETATPGTEKKPLPTQPERLEVESFDLTKLDKKPHLPSSAGDRSFFIEDDRRSKITVVSLKSNRTSRTVQTMPSVMESRTAAPKQKGAKAVLKNAKNKVKDGFRESSIKRIIASGLCIATFLVLICGVFLPFWNVYKYTESGVTTGYYGGLWNYCLLTDTSTDCTMYTEYYNAHWFRAVRFLELMAFLGMLSLLVTVIAYMFFLRQLKYVYIQWIIIGLNFGIALFILLGLIVYGASYSDSTHLSSAYGLTFCAFFGCVITGAIFLWDKIEMDKEENDKLVFRGMSGAQSSRMHSRSRMSRARSMRSKGTSLRSHANSNRSQATTQISDATKDGHGTVKKVRTTEEGKGGKQVTPRKGGKTVGNASVISKVSKKSTSKIGKAGGKPTVVKQAQGKR